MWIPYFERFSRILKLTIQWEAIMYQISNPNREIAFCNFLQKGPEFAADAKVELQFFSTLKMSTSENPDWMSEQSGLQGAASESFPDFVRRLQKYFSK